MFTARIENKIGQTRKSKRDPCVMAFFFNLIHYKIIKFF